LCALLLTALLLLLPPQSHAAETGVWDEIRALELATFSSEPSEEELEAFIPQVEALVAAREDCDPDSVRMEDGVLLWLGSDGVTNGYSPALRAQRWELTGEPISEIMTNALDGKATLMSADDPELMAFTSTGRDVACFSPYYGMKDKCDWNGITQRLVIDLASYTGGNYYIYTGT